jgi:hypothetical protein
MDNFDFAYHYPAYWRLYDFYPWTVSFTGLCLDTIIIGLY